ncbi:MAG: hypothetical protein ABJG88_10670 [Litorimonas sp.]
MMLLTSCINASKKLTLSLCLMVAATAMMAPHASAGEADIVKVKAKKTRTGLWQFSVSVRHDDAGWDHYANNWEVLSPDGERIAERVLGHPHVDEQPFTRSLSGVKIPENLTHVIIRARDSVHGYGGQTVRVDLATRKAVIITKPELPDVAKP